MSTGSFTGYPVTGAPVAQTTWATRLAHIREVLEEPVETVWKDLTLLGFANEALMTLADRMEDRERHSQLTAVSGTRAYARPSNDREITGVFCATNPMTRETRGEWMSLTAYALSATGEPSRYMVHGGTVEFRPIPNGTYVIDWYSIQGPTYLTSSTDLVDIDPGLYRAFDAYIIARAYEQLGNWEARAAYWENFDRFVAESELQQVEEENNFQSNQQRVVW